MNALQAAVLNTVLEKPVVALTIDCINQSKLVMVITHEGKLPVKSSDAIKISATVWREMFGDVFNVGTVPKRAETIVDTTTITFDFVRGAIKLSCIRADTTNHNVLERNVVDATAERDIDDILTVFTDHLHTMFLDKFTIARRIGFQEGSDFLTRPHRQPKIIPLE